MMNVKFYRWLLKSAPKNALFSRLHIADHQTVASLVFAEFMLNQVDDISCGRLNAVQGFLGSFPSDSCQDL